MAVLHPTNPDPDQLTRTTRSLRFSALAAGLIALGVYLLSIAPDISWANSAFDSPELITASATLGIAHPPGYPTYILIGKLFSFLPLGTVAFRYNLFSAVCAAVACALVVLTIGTLHPRVRPVTAIAAALLFALSPLVWSQATVAEVYSLNLLVVTAFLLAWSRDGASARSGLLLGLAITTHLTSLLLLPAYLWRGYRDWRRIGLGLVVGITPFLVLPLLSMGQSPVVWGQPTDLAGWWWLVSGKLYAPDLGISINEQWWDTLWRAVVLGPAMYVVVGHVNRGPAVTQNPHITARSRPTASLLIGTSILYILFAIRYNVPDAAMMLMPAFILLAVALVPLLARLGLTAIILPIVLVALTFPARDLSRQPPIRPLAESVLNAAPENALLLTPGDRTIFTLLYLQEVERARPDLRFVDANLFAFDWYRARLARQYSSLYLPLEDDLVALQRENLINRPFCWASLVTPVEPSAGDSLENVPQTVTTPHLFCLKGAQ